MSRVHPRVCGEARSGLFTGLSVEGPSPRVRGSPSASASPAVPRGSIPACAGKPDGHRVGRARQRVHPRVCGEARPRHPLGNRYTGPSPRVRGSRTLHRFGKWCRGSIPACAGKPMSSGRIFRWNGVHPRVCGEAVPGRFRPRRALGPSPRVRGSHHRFVVEPASCGSIPACAGKPQGSSGILRDDEVHPRVCGEALLLYADAPDLAGPSPRVRGSRDGAACD